MNLKNLLHPWIQFTRIMSLILCILCASLTQAQSTQQTPETWNQIVQKILKNGSDMDSYDGTYRTLSVFQPEDKEQTHWAKYLSAVGAADSEGTFHAWRIHAVFENWVLNENQQWEIDQWLYVLNMQGQIQRLSHYFLKEEKDGHVLEHRQWATGSIQDPIEQQRLEQFLQAWMPTSESLSSIDPNEF
jgi:hypothetical protein